ncbi:protein of unknown function [Pseudomonas sp. JV551A1]|nr:protein of unknown function [Pseudomonas sp. JV551A1]
MQDGRSAADSLFRIQGAVGFQINDQLVQVGTLFNTGVFDHIGDTTHRAERSVQLQTANATAFVFVGLTGVGRLVTTTTSYGELHVQGAVRRQVRDYVIGVDDLDIVIQLNIGSGNHPRTLFRQGQRNFVTTVQFDSQAFQVQQDFNDVFLNTFDRGVLMEYAVDLGLDYCTARHGGQQDAAQRVAQGMAETTLERLERNLGAGRTDYLHINVAGSQELIYRNLHGCTYFLALTWSRARQSGSR